MTKKQHPRAKTKLDQSFKLKKVVPMTETQQDVFDAYQEKFHLFLYGCAGTGKTYISLYLAIKEVLAYNSPYHKVVVVRSSVPSRNMGFLPGKVDEKMAVYETPYHAMLNNLFGRGDASVIARQKGFFDMVSTSFLRGVTLEDCIVIADEVQNYSFQELDTLATRLGNNAKLIMCGDIEQCDLIQSKYDQSGLPEFIKILEMMESVDFIEFLPEDIVRSGFVKEYITRKRELRNPSERPEDPKIPDSPEVAEIAA